MRKHFVLEEMLLVSMRERGARRICFSPATTVITGKNNSGKSCVIKSLMYTFGAEPVKFEQDWLRLEVASLVRFRIGGQRWSAFRYRGMYVISNEESGVRTLYRSAVTGLGPAFGQLVDFQIRLTVNRSGDVEQAPPSYYWLPFYVDQDSSWADAWSAFRGLGMFADWKAAVAGFHSGYRPAKWYEVRADVALLKKQIETPEARVKALERVLGDLKSELAGVPWDVDVDAFGSEVAQLLSELDVLRKEEGKYRRGITRLKDRRALVEAQIDVVRRTHRELSRDFRFSAQEVPDHVNCPTCGTGFANDFGQRFGLVDDELRTQDIEFELLEDLNGVEDELGKADSQLSAARASSEAIRTILQATQGAVTLEDLVDLKSRRKLATMIEQQLVEVKSDLAQLRMTIEEAESEMASLDSKDRRSRVLDDFRQRYDSGLRALGVTNVDGVDASSVFPSIPGTGSTLPRALLAYYFAFAETAKLHGTAAIGPMIIDAPNQQEQDPENLGRIMRYIRDHAMKWGQAVVGCVDQAGVDFEGKVIEIDEHDRVLVPGEYTNVREEIQPYLAMSASDSPLFGGRL